MVTEWNVLFLGLWCKFFAICKISNNSVALKTAWTFPRPQNICEGKTSSSHSDGQKSDNLVPEKIQFWFMTIKFWKELSQTHILIRSLTTPG